MKYVKIPGAQTVGAKKARMVRAHWRLMMDAELLREISFWAFMAQLVLLAVLLAGVMTNESRIERAIAKKRPLLSEEDWAVVRPGDTVLIMLRMDQMTEGQQQRMTQGVIRIMQPARASGVEVIALPVRKGDQAVVVARSAQEKGDDGGQSGDNCAGQRDPAGGQVAAQPKP